MLQGRASLEVDSHIPAHHRSMRTPCSPGRDPHQKSITHKDNHHQKLCKIPLPPPSSGKVKFHAKAILLLFNYQPAPGTWSSRDRFSFVRLHKAREAGLRGGHVGLGETWELATWAACAKAGATWC